MRVRGRCSGSGRRAGLRRVNPPHFGRLASISCLGRLHLGRGLLQVLQRELELLQPGAALGGGAEALPPEPGDLQLQALDLERETLAHRACRCGFGLRGDPGRTLGQDHGLSTGQV